MRRRTTSAVACAALLLIVTLPCRADDVGLVRPEDFTLLWWAEGAPYYLDMKTPGMPAVICMQSGTLGLALDTRTLTFPHAGRFARAFDLEAALERGREAVMALPPRALEARIVRGGVAFACTGRGTPPKDEFFFPVRFVESGRFLQRIAIEGLQFADAAGKRLEGQGRAELAFWPDRLTLTLQVDAREGELRLAVGERAASVDLANAREVTLEIFKPEAERATLDAGGGARSEWDARLGAYVVRLPTSPWRNAKGTYYPEEELDRLDRHRFTVVNDGDAERVAAIMFIPDEVGAITGLTPMLCDPDGTPSGLPVQLSKNWHSRPEKGAVMHQGQWLHACAFVRAAPRARREFVFTIAYARWGGVPAASHAQLCLIGWGHNQFWEEAAIGSFGESICYEPGRVQRRCFVDDVRPFMTLPAPTAKPHGWAGNAGGGDFLVWIDAAGDYRGFRGTRVDFRAQGPCLTDVRYVEETAGGEIAARMQVSIARSDDYLRAFHRIRYDVRAPVTWRRLAFYQLGADYYNETPSRLIAVGDGGGMREEWTAARAKGAYDRRGIPLAGAQPWASVHGLVRGELREGQAASSRGLIVRAWKATLGGKPNAVPHAATYASEWGDGNFKTAIELAPPPDVAELRPGDFVEAELEVVVFPVDAAAYYGPNGGFRAALLRDADSWRLVAREAEGNALSVDARRGSVVRAYPLEVAVGKDEGAELVVRGGLGYVPMTFTGLSRHRGYELRVDGEALDQKLHGNDFWQTDWDAASTTWRMTFNVAFDGAPHALRFCAARE